MIDIEVDNDGLLQKLWPLREAAMSDRDRFKETYIALRNGILDCGSAGIPAEFFGKKPIRLEFTPAFFIE